MNRVQQIALAIWKGKHVMMLSRIISAVVSIQVCGIDVLSRPWGPSNEVSCQVGHQGLVKYLADVESLNRSFLLKLPPILHLKILSFGFLHIPSSFSAK